MDLIRRLIEQLLENRTGLVAQRDACLVDPDTWELRTEIPEDVETERSRLNTEIATLDERLADAEEQLAIETQAEAALRRLGPALSAPSGPAIRIGSEPMLYRQHGEHSFFKDLARAHAPGERDERALERLQQHRQQVDALAAAGGLEGRALSRTDGAGGELVPPLWLVGEYVKLARAGRVTADLCRKLPLPPGTDSINLPKISTGTAVAEQTEGAAVQNTDAVTTSVSAAITTMAGQQVTSMQLVDQSPINIDEVLFADLMADLAKQVDAYVITKTAIGILNVTSINAVTYTDASPTVPELYPKVADGIQQIHTNRFLPPQAHVMHPRRWAWHLAALDASNRPLVVPNAQGPQNAFAGMDDVRSEGSVGTLQGLPVYVDANVPINLGAGTNEDRIITARFDDLLLWESVLRSRVLFETDANTLQVRFQVWEYLAFMGNRYPKAISVTSGTGLVTPTF